MKIFNVVGARPNFMKIAPIVHEMKRRGIDQMLVHTGQHYDEKMSEVFFTELDLPRPDIYLGVGSGSHAMQTARIMMEFETCCLEHKPDLIVVGGDVNSTLAVALVASKLNIPVAHVESGLRSFDRTMPEEINRIVTDHLSDFLFTTEQSANENLRNEGIPAEKIHFVGNCMIDSLLSHFRKAIERCPWSTFGVTPNSYALVTLHRPANVDDSGTLLKLSSLLNTVASKIPMLFPVHPRTRKKIMDLDITFTSNLVLCEPMSYLNFIGSMIASRFVLTDSGGIQEESSTLGVPCLTMRPNTERPVTVTMGSNRLLGTDGNMILPAVDEVLSGQWKVAERPPFWDGKAASRILDVLENSSGSPESYAQAAQTQLTLP